ARDSAYYFVCNRSKESITVNLRSDEGRKVIRELAQRADVVVENFPVGTLGRYALDFASLSALNEKLIYVSCTGFGQSGPYADKKGYDTVFQAMGGIMSLTGERGSPGEARLAGRRSHLGRVGRDRDPRLPCRAHPIWQRLPRRFLDAGRAGVAADPRCRSLFRARRNPAAAGHRASRPRALRHLSLQGR